jgi:two-component system, NtrC family, sensor kinase
MRAPGLRLQLLLLLGGLLVLTFLPLQLALATYTQISLRRLDEDQARSLGRTLAAYVREARARLGPEELLHALEQDAAQSGLVAAVVDDSSLTRPAQFGDPSTLAALQDARLEDTTPRLLRTAEHRVLGLGVPGASGRTLLAIDAERSSGRAAALIRTFGLYAFLLAVSLLTFAYFALTRLIIRPLEALSEAAQNVTLGSRQLKLPSSSVRELNELGASLKRMTDRLLAEEESLRTKIDEVERATRDLERAQNQVVRSERLASVGRLAAGLAHEIGNPIAALMGLADLLLEGELDAHEQKDFIKRMRGEAERIHRTLGELLQFARPARQGSSSGPTPSGEVETAIHDTAGLVVHQASMRDLELCIDVYPGLPQVTLATEQLIQVLLNLILNAADALQGQAGGQVSVVARPTDAGVRIDVEDNGTGVPQAVADQIFEPFFTTKEVGKGTGLGLSVCQGLIAAAGGSLLLDATHAGGARFVVQLPASGSTSAAPAAPSS